MAYTYERPDLKALAELEQLLRHLRRELAAWRRRTLKAEASCRRRRPTAGWSTAPSSSGSRQRVIELETENQALRQRIDAAKERLRSLAARLAFLEQQGRHRGVSGAKNAVRVIIGGEEYTVRSELPPEYTREVAAYLDAALKRVRDSLPVVETHKAAILAALAITDELFQARRGDREIANRVSRLADDLARLLPPAKRGSRAAAS